MPKIKVWTFIADGGDGSYSVQLFPTEAEAEAWREEDEENDGYSVDGAVDYHFIDTDEYDVVG